MGILDFHDWATMVTSWQYDDDDDDGFNDDVDDDVDYDDDDGIGGTWGMGLFSL